MTPSKKPSQRSDKRLVMIAELIENFAKYTEKENIQWDMEVISLIDEIMWVITRGDNASGLIGKPKYKEVI
jgi:hypothetical protein